MTRRAKIWRVIVALWTVVNVGGAVFAILNGELLHAAVHVALLAATYVVWRLVARTRQPSLPDVHSADARLDHIQESLDAIAIEVERIGEAQRYAVKVVTERAGNAPAKPSE